MTVQTAARTTLAHTLHTIATLLPVLTENMHRATNPTSTNGAYDGRPPAPIAHLALADDAHRTITSWCQIVQDDRGLTGARGTTVERTRWLERHAAWLQSHPAADDAVDELTHLADRIRRAIAPAGRRIPVGACPLCQPAGTGILKACLDTGHGMPPVICNTDPAHEWTGAYYGLLSQLIGADDTECLTPAGFAAYLRAAQGAAVQPATVRQWCARHPDMLGYDPATSTIHRLTATLWWLAR